MLKNLMFAQELANCLGGIDINLVSKTDNSLPKLIREKFYGNIIPVATDASILNYLGEMELNCVYQLSGILGLHFIIIRLPDEDHYLIAGPCMHEHISDRRIRNQLRTLHLNSDSIQAFISFCSWQPVLSREKLQHLGLLLGRHVLDLPDPVPFRFFEYHWNESAPLEMLPEQQLEQEKIRQIERRYEASTAMTEAIKQGNFYLALSILPRIKSDTPSIARNPDPLRNLQNFCIIVNTQLRHAMEDLHIHPYQLDKVSNEIGWHIELLKTPDEAMAYFPQIIRQYCDLSVEKKYSHLEPFSRQAIVYIKTHLSDNLTVKEAAKALSANANYLSGKFHQEVGMTFTDFVNQERTAQAAVLLQTTNMQIQQIASACGYNNTSYFSKQFARFYGTTPREYRTHQKKETV